jgi:hypothetical protein
MVAYSFQRRFVNPIRVGLGLEQLEHFPPAAGPKRHTIRAPRRRGHAREGQQLQLFFGLRTQHCFLIARALCIRSSPITLVFEEKSQGIVAPSLDLPQWGYKSLDAFAVGDGFEDWKALKTYWLVERGVEDKFEGTIIFWGSNKGEHDDPC